MSELITEEDALRQYPELQQLMTIRCAGWNFRIIEDDAHRLTGLAASMSRK